MKKINLDETIGSGDMVYLTHFDEAVANAVTTLEREGAKIFDAYDVHVTIYGEDRDASKPVESDRINESIDKLRGTMVTNGAFSAPLLSCTRILVNGDTVSYAFVSPAAAADGGTTWKGLDADAMAHLLEEIYGSGTYDDGEWNTIFKEYGSPYRVMPSPAETVKAVHWVVTAIPDDGAERVAMALFHERGDAQAYAKTLGEGREPFVSSADYLECLLDRARFATKRTGAKHCGD